MMINGAIQSRVVCQLSVYFSEKKKCENESHECVCHCRRLYTCVRACVCLADCSTQSSDIPPDSSELFTVPGLSESGKERERGEVRRGRGKPRQ